MAIEVAVGQEIPHFVRTSRLGAWNRFAAVNEEFIPIHMEDEAGVAAGNPGAFGMGNLQLAYLHAMLRQWLGDDGGRVLSVTVQYRAPNLRGPDTHARGRVTAVRDEGSETIVDLEVWTETDEGTVMAPGTASVALTR